MSPWTEIAVGLLVCIVLGITILVPKDDEVPRA